ncbi:MAG: DUF4906 domain-containing protein [Alistipes sp.]|nr:DUF4906 domain-containing protein [Alistipes sp.]
MRYIKFLAAIVALVAATACVTSEVDDMPIISAGSNGELQIVGRVTQYSDCDVATRSKKEGDESKVTSMGLALFPIENGTIGNCVYYDYQLGGSIVFIVDRHDAVFNSYENTQFAMYIFANMQDAAGFPTTSEAGVSKSLAYFTNCAVASTINVEEVPANGFPMMGSLGHTDGKVLILKPSQTDANVDGLPLVDNVPTDNLEIPLKSMYAKFSFTIAAKPDQEIVGNKAPRFDLVKYSVNNIAATVDCDSDTNSDNAVISTTGEIGVGNYAQGATTATFDFYLPERYLSPNKAIDDVLPAELKKKGSYGTDVDADQNGYRDEDEKYHQRYKNKLVEDKAATYVTINGKYTDHQGHAYDVAYNIYLGGNNYDNFDVIRNTHYNNSITIRGISASDDQATNTNGVAIDWRVNVERSTPLVINLRRESLLDAHYEVRPLRLRLVGEDIPTGTSATVEIFNEDGTATNIPTWIRLEASDSSSDHITSGVSTGKRKYFTVDLVTKTLAANTSITVNNLTKDNQTLWIYVDENLDTKSRAAIVRVTYGGDAKDFKIVQNGLYSVVGADSGNTYYIEQYEEYLYNYDSEDSYGQTKDEGMSWGLPNVQLSNEHRSFTNDTNNSSWNNYLNNNILPTYDFYIAKHDGTFAADAGATMVHSYAGQHFTEDIVLKSKNGVSNLTMDQQASGAVEYCYNRNKRNSDGSITKILWYLPSADELEDFIVPAYSSFEEFQDNYYWTSQPAYIRNVYYYEDGSNTFPFIVYDDNPEYARATKVVAKGNDVYEYALSGLNEETNIIDSSTGKLLDFTGSGEINFGYFYLMYRWKNGTADETFGQTGFGGVVNGTQYLGEEFGEKRGGSLTGTRYHVHLGHLYDMTQEGYHHRTKKNRVRCVRADLTTNNQQMVLVYTVSTTPATTLDKSGNTMYVMRNTAYTSTYLTTSGTNVAASDADLSFDNYVVIEDNKIKSVAKSQYFDGYNGNVSFNNNGTSYTISNSSGSNFTISYTRSSWISSTTYYLKQTSNTAVSMSSGNSGNRYWQFYEVKKEYKVVE